MSDVSSVLFLTTAVLSKAADPIVRDAHQMRCMIGHLTGADHDAHEGDGERALWCQPTPEVVIVQTRGAPVNWAMAPGLTTKTAHASVRTDYMIGDHVTMMLVAETDKTKNERAPGERAILRRYRAPRTEPEIRRWVTERIGDAVDIVNLNIESMDPIRAAKKTGRFGVGRTAIHATGRVTDPTALARHIEVGVGRGKAYGCGLLMVTAA